MDLDQTARDLVAELDEALGLFDIVCLYECTWFLAGLGLSEEDSARLCLDAYREICASYPDLTLVWVRWPHVTARAARPADPGTELDFHLDPTSSADVELLALARLPAR